MSSKLKQFTFSHKRYIDDAMYFITETLVVSCHRIHALYQSG